MKEIFSLIDKDLMKKAKKIAESQIKKFDLNIPREVLDKKINLLISDIYDKLLEEQRHR